MSKRIVEFALEKGVDVIGLENLDGIRKRTKVRKKQRYDFESWVYRKLQFMIEYKARERSILVVYVDPRHTSITCPRCYHVNRANRNGKLFQCKACGYTLNADLVGARNIERRTREFRYMRDSLGCCQPPERPFEGQAPPSRAG